MGGGPWDGTVHSARQSAWKAAGYSSAFTHDEDIRAGRKAAGIDPLNDPRRKAGPKSKYAGRVVREACIDAEHPDPTAIAVVFDDTGSMGDLARVVQQKLPTLHERLVGREVSDPEILFGAVGDARSDDFPLQMGQFEMGNNGDAQLESLYLEGNGGGQGSETYELAALYLAAAAVMEPFEQYGKKGYLFTVGDERPAGGVYRDYGFGKTFQNLTGMPLEADVDAETVVALVTEKFHWFHFVVDSTKFGGMYRPDHALGAWRRLLGDRAQVLGEPEALPEAIAAIVAVMEGKIDRATAEQDVGNALVLTA